jgi:hypothetical protein
MGADEMTGNTLSADRIRYAQPTRAGADETSSSREVLEVGTLPASPTWEPAVDQALERLQHLSTNWDGQGGGPVSPAAAIRTELLLSRMLEVTSPAPSLAPLNSGGVFLAWRGQTVDVELEIEINHESWLTIEDETGGVNFDGNLDDGGFRAFSDIVRRLGS